MQRLNYLISFGDSLPEKGQRSMVMAGKEIKEGHDHPLKECNA